MPSTVTPIHALNAIWFTVLATMAAKALESRKTSEETKSLAGTVLAQAEHPAKKRN